MAKLVHITTEPITQWVLCRGQNTYMADRGFEVHAVCSPGPHLDKLAKRDGVGIHAVTITREISPFRDLVALVRLYAVLRTIRPAIVQVSTPKAALLGALAAWAARVPVRVFLIRGLISERAQGGKRHLLRWLEWLTARLCHSVISNSPSLLAITRRRGILGPEEGKVLVNGMSNGVDVRRFDPAQINSPDRTPQGAQLPERIYSPTASVVGMIGRLARDKGIEEIAFAWRRIREEFPDAVLLLVGPWEEKDQVSDLARRELESDDRVVVTGWVEDVVPYYRAMDVFVFPSSGEGFPNAPMEAACMKLPVVATNVVGCVDAVQDGVSGKLVPLGDGAALADAIRMYLASPKLRQEHGQAGRDRILRDFQQEPIWESLYHEYARLLKEKGLPFPQAPICEQRASQHLRRVQFSHGTVDKTPA